MLPEKGKISSLQAVFLLVMSVFATVILFVPGVSASYARQDAWISILLTAAAGLIIALIAVKLGRYFPGKTLFEYLEIMLGKTSGKAVGALYLFWFLYIAAAIVREYVSFLVIFFPRTPQVVMSAAGIMAVAYAVYGGLEVLARANQVFFPVIMVSFLVLAFLSIPQMDFINLLPVLEASPASIVKGALVPLGWFGEIFVISVLLPYVNRSEQARRIALTSVLIITSVFEMSIMGVISIFGPSVTASYFLALLNGARMIHIANFIERLEALLVLIWILSGGIKLGVFYWTTVLGSAQMASLKDYRALVPPVGAAILALSIFNFTSTMDLVGFGSTAWPFYALTFELIIPLFLLAAAAIGKAGRAV
jgi:spore germination protein KB